MLGRIETVIEWLDKNILLVKKNETSIQNRGINLKIEYDFLNMSLQVNY